MHSTGTTPNIPYYYQQWYRDMIVSVYHRAMEPVFPCRVLCTRHCPIIYEAQCAPDQPCARYESEDETPWLAELESDPRVRGSASVAGSESLHPNEPS